MSKAIYLSIDAMGGDLGPRLCVEAVLSFLERHSNVHIILVGDSQTLTSLIPNLQQLERIRIVHAEDVVSMNDKPGIALRHKRNSSMWQSLELVAKGEADACVSGGNTGALMAMSRYLITTYEGMSRPAICKPMPTAKGKSFFLDLGANIDCSSQQLVQFAEMGAALAKVYGKPMPKVALLNIGAETTKGSGDIREAAEILSQRKEMNFCGFVEGDGLYTGNYDVVVCDGFAGNVALKVSEGVVQFVFGSLKSHLASSIVRRILSFLIKPLLASWAKRFDPSRYNGAALLGLKKIVVKSHGKADKEGFVNALETALEQVQADIPNKIEQCLVS